jgi:hypothetical protein
MNEIVKKLERLARVNSPVILTAIGVSGTITTAYLTGRAAYESAFVILEKEHELETGYLTTKEKTEYVWRLYIPATVSGVATIVCIIGATRIGARRAAALTAAYSLSDKAFAEYREKITESIGAKKEKALRDEIAQQQITQNPPTKELIIAGSGSVLCCELFTGRYFHSDMETLRKAQNDINAKLVGHEYASLADFYYIVGLPYTSYCSDIGWTSDKLMSLDFSTVLSDDNRPCIAFDYNYTKPF